MFVTPKNPAPLALASRVLDAELPAFVMGVVNVTPDSFWGGSRRHGVDEAVAAALRMEEDGAAIVDIGGESSRPGAAYVDEREEIARVIPVVEAIRARSRVAVSVDTRKAQVFRAAFEAGADIFNDISALEDGDGGLSDYAAKMKFPVILMHKRGNPATMQADTGYADAFGEVDEYLRRRAGYALAHGIAADKIIVDPGIGFGKDFDANRALIQKCGALCGQHYPVLVGLSRKALIGQITGRDTDGRLWGTLAASMLCVLYGASIVRVHDVPQTVDCLKTLRSLT